MSGHSPAQSPNAIGTLPQQAPGLRPIAPTSSSDSPFPESDGPAAHGAVATDHLDTARSEMTTSNDTAAIGGGVARMDHHVLNEANAHAATDWRDDLTHHYLAVSYQPDSAALHATAVVHHESPAHHTYTRLPIPVLREFVGDLQRVLDLHDAAQAPVQIRKAA